MRWWRFCKRRLIASRRPFQSPRPTSRTIGAMKKIRTRREHTAPTSAIPAQAAEVERSSPPLRGESAIFPFGILRAVKNPG
jgi:hypothetical protein